MALAYVSMGSERLIQSEGGFDFFTNLQNVPGIEYRGLWKLSQFKVCFRGLLGGFDLLFLIC